MHRSQILWRLALTAAVAAVAAPGNAQPPAGTTLPYDAAKARVKNTNMHGIYQGHQSPKGTFPFVVALIQSDAKNTEEDIYFGQYCTGALIANHWVLTSAQCVSTEEDGKTVALASDKIDAYVGSIDFKSGKRIKVKRIIVHSDYNTSTYDNDIALIELAANAPANMTKTVAPATTQSETTLASVGKKVTVAGWGQTEKEDDPRPKILRYVEMDVLDSGMCNANIVKYRVTNGLDGWAKVVRTQFGLSDAIAGQARTMVEENTGRVVNDNMLCSGRVRTRRDTCGGDTGAPLFTKGADGRFTLVGLSSWGEGCGMSDKGLYGIYTRVSRYDAWIKQNLK